MICVLAKIRQMIICCVWCVSAVQQDVSADLPGHPLPGRLLLALASCQLFHGPVMAAVLLSNVVLVVMLTRCLSCACGTLLELPIRQAPGCLCWPCMSYVRCCTC